MRTLFKHVLAQVQSCILREDVPFGVLCEQVAQRSGQTAIQMCAMLESSLNPVRNSLNLAILLDDSIRLPSRARPR